MARMIPEVRPDEIDHPSEQLVYRALEHLPEAYVVLHSYPWLRPDRSFTSEPLREGEADFVVLHPERGMLIVEVKGGEPELRSRTWYRGGREMRDPFQQAQRNRYALLEAIRERTHGRVSRYDLVHGDLVVFPHAIYDGELPHNADPRTLIDGRGLRDIDRRIEETFSAWTRQPLALSRVQFGELLNALLPKLRLVRCVGADIQTEAARIVQTTEQQRAVLSGLLASDRVLIEGVAGSGKTLLALEFAVTLAAQGARTLLVCFNKHLASWLQEQAAAEPRLTNARDLLDISTFHSLAFSLAHKARVEFEVPQHEQQFWDKEVPLILEQAIEVLNAAGSSPEFDAVVVDEAQDFFDDWWVTVESLTRGGRTGRLYAFLDLKQSLRGGTVTPPVELPARFHLSINCRNTKAVALTGAKFGNVPVTVNPAAPDGQPPVVIRAPAANAQAGLVLSELRRLLRSGIRPGQIAVIGPAARERSCLAQCPEVEGVPFTSEPALWRRGEALLVTTARSFKGLEADIVLVYDLAGFGPQFTRTDLYVAWTRARHRLTLICHGAEARSEIEVALAQALPAEG